MKKVLRLIGIAIAVFLIGAYVHWKLNYTPTQAFQFPENEIAGVQSGLGASVNFGNSPSLPVEEAAAFINARSGITLSTAVKNRLIALESQTMYNGRPRKTVSQISSAITDTWFWRLPQLTDSQINEIGNCTRAAVDSPWAQCAGVELRLGSGHVAKDINTWMSKACAYRDASTAEAIAQRSATPNKIYSLVDYRSQLYTVSLNSWNRNQGLTPLQAFLIFYSVVTDDMMLGPMSSLNEVMEALEDRLQERFPGTYTSCQGRKPFGYYGYIYSTHTPVLFNEQVQNAFIDRL